MTLAEEEARIAEGMTGFSWRVLCNPREIYVPINTEQPLVKFFSEALMNSWKHSGITSGTIELRNSEQSITVIVSDNRNRTGQRLQADPDIPYKGRSPKFLTVS